MEYQGTAQYFNKISLEEACKQTKEFIKQAKHLKHQGAKLSSIQDFELNSEEIGYSYDNFLNEKYVSIIDQTVEYIKQFDENEIEILLNKVIE